MRDGSAFFVVTNERDARYFDVYRYDAATYDRTLLYRNDQGYLPDAVSDDGQRVSLEKPNTTNDSDIYLWNAGTRNVTHVSPHQGEAQFTAPAFDRPAKHFYYLTNDGGEFTALKRYRLADGNEKAGWMSPSPNSPRPAAIA